MKASNDRPKVLDYLKFPKVGQNLFGKKVPSREAALFASAFLKYFQAFLGAEPYNFQILEGGQTHTYHLFHYFC